MKFFLPIFLILSFAFVFTVSQGATGAWTPIQNISDPHVKEIAQFAISEHNKAANATKLTLSKILGGDTQIVAGTNYRLNLLAKDASGHEGKYQAVVWEQLPPKPMQLTSFKPILSQGAPATVSQGPPALGGWTPIKNIRDPHIKEIAQFAISEHNKAANATKLTLSKILGGDTQIVAGTNYRLNLLAKDASGHEGKYQAVVWEQLPPKPMQLTSFKPILSQGAPATVSQGPPTLGGWTPIKNIRDPHIKEIAQFAISEHNKAANATKLTLGKILGGDMQIVAGTNYRLNLLAKDASGHEGKYQAVVWEQLPPKPMQLTSFNPLLS